jgi:hypothetical protein
MGELTALRHRLPGGGALHETSVVGTPVCAENPTAYVPREPRVVPGSSSIASCPARPGLTIRSMTGPHASHPRRALSGRAWRSRSTRRADRGAGREPIGDEESAATLGGLLPELPPPPQGPIGKALGQPPVAEHPGHVQSLRHRPAPRGQQRRWGGVSGGGDPTKPASWGAPKVSDPGTKAQAAARRSSSAWQSPRCVRERARHTRRNPRSPALAPRSGSPPTLIHPVTRPFRPTSMPTASRAGMTIGRVRSTSTAKDPSQMLGGAGHGSGEDAPSFAGASVVLRLRMVLSLRSATVAPVHHPVRKRKGSQHRPLT